MAAKELTPSVLGTKEHWDNMYEQEYKDYTESKVAGEDWFGPNIGKKIVQYLKLHGYAPTDAVIDLGCGCGAVLVALHNAGFSNLTGVDYSEKAIELCKEIAEDENFDAKLQVVDLVDGSCDNLGKFRICIDKGTYDAISLNPDLDQGEARSRYLKNVYQLLEDNGIFVLASCNWTQAELKVHAEALFNVKGTIETTKFSFGGVTGNDVTIVVLAKSPS